MTTNKQAMPAPLEIGEEVTVGKHGTVIWKVSEVYEGGGVRLHNPKGKTAASSYRNILSIEVAGKLHRTNGRPIARKPR